MANNDAPLIEDWESEGEDEVESLPEMETKTVEPSMDKVKVDIPKQNDKPARRPVKYAEMYRTQRLRGNQRNWNNMKSHQLVSNFVMYNKICYACGSFNHLQVGCKYHQRDKMVNGTNHSMVNHSANTVPKAVLIRTGLKHVNHVRLVNPKSTRRHITKNISYLTDFKEFNEGYVAFGGGAKGGKVTDKGIIKTSKLDFEDVYFVKELKFNLFNVSHMCDKNKSVLFTETKCFVLSPDFKLADESHVLLKVPRKNNMYSVDMKNIVSKKDVTCLVAKATNDELML
nr:ribonuclease H-like domain-containing protein [Tanacetum cinerariifolium]